MSIDPKTLKIGDVVHVRGVIDSPPNGEWLHVTLDGVRNLMAFKISEIVHVEPRPIAVGDRVTVEDGFDCEVKAVCKGFAWCFSGKHGFVTRHIDTLRHAEAS